ncbi:MAG: hypothetical protein ABIL25_03955 [candidate division WOR-3 bacterium]
MVGTDTGAKGLTGAYNPHRKDVMMRMSDRSNLAGRIMAVVLLTAATLAAWEPPVVLYQNDTACYLPLANTWALAAAHDTLHAVWYGAANGSYDIFYRRSLDNGVSWQPPIRISDDSVYSGYPGVAIAGPFVHITWVRGIDEQGDSGAQVYYRRSTNAGATFEPAVQLSHSSGGYYGAWFPCIITEGTCVHLAWEDDRLGDDQIYYRRSTDNGATWNTENPVLNLTGYVNPTLAAIGTTIICAYYDFWGEVVYYQRSTNNGNTWLARVGIPTPDVSDCPCLASAGDTVHLAYCDGRNGFWDVWYRRSTDRGVTWTQDTCICPDMNQTWTVNIAASGSNVHVVRGDMGAYQVHYIRSTDGGRTWDPEQCISESVPGHDAMHYTVAAADSNVHVTFDKEKWIYYRRWLGGNPVGIGQERVLAGLGRSSTMFSVSVRMRGKEHEEFDVFDFTGRRVGRFLGAELGLNLAAGTYVIRPAHGRTDRMKLVKVR